jgi:histone deacetylase 1/2
MTNDMECLNIHDAYKGNDQVQVANGTHIPISHVGETFISGPRYSLHLKNVLLTPRISKNLVPANKLANDNNYFLELHPSSLFVKDLTTRTTLLHGKAKDGMYPVPTPSSIRQAHHQAHHVSTSKELWHRRLGHPASPIIQAILHSNKLAFSPSKNTAMHVIGKSSSTPL